MHAIYRTLMILKVRKKIIYNDNLLIFENTV